MLKKVMLGCILGFSLCFGYNYTQNQIDKDLQKLFTLVSDTHDVKIGNEVHTLDMKRILRMTAMIESNYGRDKKRPKSVAKTYMQIEKRSADFYLKQVPILKDYIEKNLGRKLIWNNNSDAMFVAYLIYMSKLKVHSSWVTKFKTTKYFSHKDADYYIYKIMYNSILGATTKSTWDRREKQLENL